MIKSKITTLIMAILMTAAVLLLAFVMLNPNYVSAITKNTSMPYVKAMDKMQIMSLEILVDESEWQTMLQNATAEEYIRADVVINGVKVKNVGIRPKGNSSLTTVAQMSNSDRYSFKIEFDHYVKGQTWLGLDKIALNNIQSDSTYMKEYFSYDILNYIGVETPLYAYADISVNGSNWGFYLAVECLEESYVTRNFSGIGKLYKPDSMGMRGDGRMNEIVIERNGDNTRQLTEQIQVSEIPEEADQQPEEQTTTSRRQNRGDGGVVGGGFGMSYGGVTLVYTGDEIDSYYAIFENAKIEATTTDYKRVITALKNLSTSTDLEKYVDVEATLRYFAGHTVVVNLDSYVGTMCHNYYLYENNGQITILPWDYNLAFGGFMSGNISDVVNFPIDTPVSGASLDDRPLLGKLLEVDEYLEIYHEYLRDIVDGYFNSGIYEYTVNYLNSMIAPYVEKDSSAFYSYEEYEKGVEAILELGKLRALSIEGQLDGTVPSTSEAQRDNPELLIEATTVSLSDLGSNSFGGGGFGGDIGGFSINGLDMTTLQEAMEILMAANGNLTEEQLLQLEELGISQELIEQAQSMMNRIPGGNRNFNRFEQQTPDQGGNLTQPDVNIAPLTGTRETPAAQGISFNSQTNISVTQGNLNLNEMPSTNNNFGGMATPNGDGGGMTFPDGTINFPTQVMPEDSQGDLNRFQGNFNLGEMPTSERASPDGGMEVPQQMPFGAQEIPNFSDESQSFENFQLPSGEFWGSTTLPSDIPEGSDTFVPPESSEGQQNFDSDQQFQEFQPGQFGGWGEEGMTFPGGMGEGMMLGNGNNNSQGSSNRSYNTALIIGSMVLLIAGLIFVTMFKRRKLLSP